ncbi:hypothetical protein A3Q56_00327 [Intoshia linei]|uniref:Uncharacterized protein n=1 Tax=Intoshia linei TaxID=1819745 RepID=A0A177BC37_9BILA|nr:hypothetical protein A3Q56_00327 [Intoshia linei]
MQDFNCNVKIDKSMNGDIANHSLNNDIVMQSPKVEKIAKVIEYNKHDVPKISSRYVKMSNKMFCVAVAFDKELNFDNIERDAAPLP